MDNYFKISLNILQQVLTDKAYINLALKDVEKDINRPVITKIVYGVIETYYELQFVIDNLCTNKPRSNADIILKIGIYCLKYLSIPAYAVCNELVALAIPQEKGFINAVLKKVVNGEYPTPSQKSNKYLEVTYNLPYEIIKLVQNDYPKAYKKILAANTAEFTYEHIRIAERYKEDFDLINSIKFFQKTPYGYFVKITDDIKASLNLGETTVQSLTSCLAIHLLGDVKGVKVLDCCSAPGGKSVLLAERGAIVDATDILPSRIRLIESYAERMKVNLSISVSDATKLDSSKIEKYDIVIADVPCSGLGVLSKRQDAMINKTVDDILTLPQLQYAILDNVANYVRIGGILQYSTCTILKEENSGVIAKFLENNKGYVISPIKYNEKEFQELQFLPNGKGLDGFYICRLKRKY